MDNDEVLRLLERIGQRDEAAFRELYRAFSRLASNTHDTRMTEDQSRGKAIRSGQEKA